MKTKRAANQVFHLTCSLQEVIVLRVLLDMAKVDYATSGPKDSKFLPQITRMAEQLEKLTS